MQKQTKMQQAFSKAAGHQHSPKPLVRQVQAAINRLRFNLKPTQQKEDKS